MRTKTLLVAVLASATLACNTVGPRVLRTARQPYNEALAMSRDQEILLNLLRIAEGRKPYFLKFDQVSTTYEFHAGAEIGAAITDVLGKTDSDESAPTGQTTTGTRANTDTDGFTAGASAGWQEKPIVTYKPLTGEGFTKRLMAPVSLENLALLYEAGYDGKLLVNTFVTRVGNLFSGDTRLSGAGGLADIVQKLQKHRHLQFLPVERRTADGKTKLQPKLLVVLRSYELPKGVRSKGKGEISREVCEFLCLFPGSGCEEKHDTYCKACESLEDIKGKKGAQAYIRIDDAGPQELVVPETLHEPPEGSTGCVWRTKKATARRPATTPPPTPVIATRPLAGAIRHALDIPWQKAGVDLLKWCGDREQQEPKKQMLRVECNDNRPSESEAFLAASYRGKWFSIPKDDRSKQVFLFFSLVYTMQAAEPQVSTSPEVVIPIGF